MSTSRVTRIEVALARFSVRLGALLGGSQTMTVAGLDGPVTIAVSQPCSICPVTRPHSHGGAA
jgi:hypothetical protein